MEECEVLCNRLAIMVNGELKCIGSSQELTRLHLVGFNIIVRLKQGSSSHEIENVKTHMTTELPCSLVDSNSVSTQPMLLLPSLNLGSFSLIIVLIFRVF